MIVVADQNMALPDETFGWHTRLVLLPGRAIRAIDLAAAGACST